MQTKKDVLKNRLFSNYFMLAAFISPVKFFKMVFCGVKFRAKFEVLQGFTTKTICVSRCMLFKNHLNQTFLP